MFIKSHTLHLNYKYFCSTSQIPVYIELINKVTDLQLKVPYWTKILLIYGALLFCFDSEMCVDHWKEEIISFPTIPISSLYSKG